jgi:hypothetical protein
VQHEQIQNSIQLKPWTIPGQSTWDFRCTKWPEGRHFSSNSLVFPYLSSSLMILTGHNVKGLGLVLPSYMCSKSNESEDGAGSVSHIGQSHLHIDMTCDAVFNGHYLENKRVIRV